AACPQTTFILGHLGKPKAVPGPQPSWEAGLALVARQPNVLCKVSAPIDLGDDPLLTAAYAAPLIRHAVAAFGYDRVLFGSNYPTCLVATTYAAWAACVGRTLRDATPGEARRLYEENARRVYGLGPRGGEG